MQNEDEIRQRVKELREWTEQLAAALRELGVRTFPTETYFFLADFAPYDASVLAEHLKKHQILVKPLNDPRLGTGFLRVTTATPVENERVVETLKQVLG